MFTKNMQDLESELDYWIYLLQKAEHLLEEDMRELKARNPIIEETFEALQDISLDRKIRDYYELRLKSERDFNAREDYAYDKGMEQGIERGIEKVRYGYRLYHWDCRITRKLPGAIF